MNAHVSAPSDAAMAAKALHEEEQPAKQKDAVAVTQEVMARAESILVRAGPPDRSNDDFDWFTDESVVLKAQPATAIYHNAKGHIVIRQERSWAEDSDPYVTIAPENAVTFMEALAKRARE
jgi:hypothetical protein